jgi:hypothetical protein
MTDRRREPSGQSVGRAADGVLGFGSLGSESAAAVHRRRPGLPTLGVVRFLALQHLILLSTQRGVRVITWAHLCQGVKPSPQMGLNPSAGSSSSSSPGAILTRRSRSSQLRQPQFSTPVVNPPRLEFDSLPTLSFLI